jgi:predicted phosphoribosyltransferase
MAYAAEPRPWQPFLDRDDAGSRLGLALRRPLDAAMPRDRQPWNGRGRGIGRHGSRSQDHVHDDGAGQRFAPTANALVLGLARGGVPVAAGVARALGLPLGVLVVRKLGVPGSPEVAFGAVASYAGKTAAVHLERTVQELRRHGYGIEELDGVEREERAELARRQALYVRTPQQAVAGRTVLLCDDGLATGATMHAAVSVVREAGAAAVLACVPAAPQAVCADLAAVADRVVCLQPWPNLRAVSEAYLSFGQVGDAEVLARLGGSEPPSDGSGTPKR